MVMAPGIQHRPMFEERPPQTYIETFQSQIPHDFSSVQMKAEDRLVMVKALLCPLGLLCVTQENQLPRQIDMRQSFLPIVTSTWQQESKLSSSLLTAPANGKINFLFCRLTVDFFFLAQVRCVSICMGFASWRELWGAIWVATPSIPKRLYPYTSSAVT